LLDTQRVLTGIKPERFPDEPFSDFVLLDPAHTPNHKNYTKEIGLRELGEKPIRYELSASDTTITPAEMGRAFCDSLAQIYSKVLGHEFAPEKVTEQELQKLHDTFGIYALSGDGEEEYQRALASAGFKSHGSDKYANTVWTVHPRNVLTAMQPPQAPQTF
jgi:hypothetical protein